MNPTDYRPISLLTLCRMFLKKNFLCLRLTEYFYNNKLLVGNHCGFIKGVATEDPIFKLRNEILSALNNKTMAGNILLWN